MAEEEVCFYYLFNINWILVYLEKKKRKKRKGLSRIGIGVGIGIKEDRKNFEKKRKSIFSTLLFFSPLIQQVWKVSRDKNLDTGFTCSPCSFFKWIGLDWIDLIWNKGGGGGDEFFFF